MEEKATRLQSSSDLKILIHSITQTIFYFDFYEHNTNLLTRDHPFVLILCSFLYLMYLEEGCIVTAEQYKMHAAAELND